MQILIVEDDRRMASLLQRGLQQEGHVAAVAGDGREALDYALSRELDVIVLDVMIPEIDGLALARRLGARGCQIPILMLTARDAPRDIVVGLDSGADDYLTKPFAFEELLARIRAVSRRGPIPRRLVLTMGDLKLDPAAHRAWRGKRELNLTPKEFQLLELLMRRAGRTLSRDSIIESVWGHGAEVELNTVDVFVSSLRRKVNASGTPSLIHTVRGIGFCLTETEP